MTLAPDFGEVLYLCSCAIQVANQAVTTFPDTPNMNGAELKVMSDLGDMNLDPIAGSQGPSGQAIFGLRDAVLEWGMDPVGDPELLVPLTDTPNDIGLYWLIDDLDDQGHVTAEWAYIWWGTYYRQIMMGSVGPPGAVPKVDPIINQIAPGLPQSIVPTGPTLAPTWTFNLPSPAGAPGVVSPIYGWPDINEVLFAPPSDLAAAGSGTGGTLAAGTYYYVVTVVNANGETTISNEVSATLTGTTSKVTLTWTAPGTGTAVRIYRGTTATTVVDGKRIPSETTLIGVVIANVTTFVDTGIAGSPATPPYASVLAFTGTYAPNGSPQFAPFDVEQYLPQAFSMPTSDFIPFVGITQRGFIGSFELPPQPWPWTPIVWGHLCAGASASAELMIGCQVLLDDKDNGQQVARGFGTPLGEINIMPHYSTPQTPNANITPKNARAVIPASPTALASTRSSSGGTLAANTYYYAVTALGKGVETPPSTEVSVTTTGSTSSIALSWVGVKNATSYNVYRGTASGAEDLLGTVTGTTFADTGLSPKSPAVPVPPPTTLYVNLYNDGQLGFYNFWPSPAPSPLQQFLDQLSNSIGRTVANIENVVGLIEAWPGQVTHDIQTQLNAVANMIGSSQGTQAIEAGLSDVQQFLTAFGAQVTNLAVALGLGGLVNDLQALAAGIEAFSSTITNEIQSAIDNVANSFHIPGVGSTTSMIASQINTLQPALQSLADLLGANSVPNIITALTGFGGTVTTEVQLALNGVANSLGFVGSQTVGSVITHLTDFQSNLDGVATAIGADVGAGVGEVVGLLAPFISTGVDGGTQIAMDALAFFLGLPGVSTTIAELISILMPLLGDIFSGLTTPAQMFVWVIPMLQDERVL